MSMLSDEQILMMAATFAEEAFGDSSTLCSEFIRFARAIESAAIEAHKAQPMKPSERRLIGWRTSEFLWETADIDTARSWEPNFHILPIFEGDPNTQLAAPQEAPVDDKAHPRFIAGYTAGLNDRELEHKAVPDWIDGCPRNHWAEEWFIAKLDTGERAVLKALPEDHSYDFRTADETYYKAHRIKAWMQFSDSKYLAPADRCPSHESEQGGAE